MKKHPMSEVAEALRFLGSKGYNLTTVYETVKKTGSNAVELAEKLRRAS
ncbi:MAG: hypothetical protein QM401_07310 [Bacillota bacterium]|nr:hypothetical protein [Bacillota bacterium]